mgnify:CR=1 FL=1
MSEYIERSALLQSLKSSGVASDFALYKISNFPAADVAPVVHAYWKRVDKDDGGHDTVCSHCSTPIVTYLETPYCHNCGAKMDGGRYK